MNDSMGSGMHQQVGEERNVELLLRITEALRKLSIEVVRLEYEAGESRVIAYARERGSASWYELVTLCIEIEQQLMALLERRYPGHFQGDKSKGFFEWNLLTDDLIHEHTRIYCGF